MNNFSVKEENNLVNIKMPKEFNFNCYKEFRDIYMKAPNSQKFKLDFSMTDFVDSSALGMLLQLREYTGEKSEQVLLVNSSDSVKNIFKVANFDKLFTVN